MLNVFGTEKLQVQLSDGRMMPLEDLVRDYERLLKGESLKKAFISEPKDEKAITKELKVGVWFRIDRDIIVKNKEEIRRKCNDAGTEGKKLWERFEDSNKVADENPDQYPRVIETYIFESSKYDYQTDQEMQDMCKKKGEGKCDEVICDLELQMRICNGERVDDLVKKPDKLPRVRIIKFRDGFTGYFGGGADFNCNFPPANLEKNDSYPEFLYYRNTPYVFRRVLSWP